MNDAKLPIAGWYPDPEDSSRRRWWDGRQWTAEVQAEPEPVPPVAPTRPIESAEPEFPPLPEQQGEAEADEEDEAAPAGRPDELSSPFGVTSLEAEEATEADEEEPAEGGGRFSRLRLGLGLIIAIVIIVGVVILTGGGSKPPDGVLITKQQFGTAWPFSVPQGYVDCKGGGKNFGPVTFTAPDGTVYGVNGIALSDGYPAVRPIWLESTDPKSDDPRVPIGPIIDKGLTLCQ